MLKKSLFSSLAALVTLVLLMNFAQAVTISLVPVGNPGNFGEQSRLAIYGDETY